MSERDIVREHRRFSPQREGVATWQRQELGRKALIISADAQPERDPEVEIHVKPADRDAGRWRFPTTHSV